MQNGLIFLAGQIGLVPETMLLAHGIEAQAVQLFRNIVKTLEALDSNVCHTMGGVVYCTSVERESLVNRCRSLLKNNGYQKNLYDHEYDSDESDDNIDQNVERQVLVVRFDKMI